MVLPEYNAIFVHVPKTAGQSIENFLLQSLGKNRSEHAAGHLLKKNNDPAKGPERLAHLTHSQYSSLGYLDSYKLKNPYSFAYVRNPWCRVVSFYKYSGFSNLVSFKDYTLTYLPVLFEEAYWFYKPQFQFVCNAKKEITVTFLGKYEALETDFAHVAAYLNLPFKELPKDNASKGIKRFSRKSLRLVLKHPSILRNLAIKNSDVLNYQDYYCKASKAMVQELYRDDIKLFNYSF